MNVTEFFEIFESELKQNKALTSYHRLVNSSSRYHFRKSYMQQRLEYVSEKISKKGASIWDVGCGFGTSAIFFALNGFKVHGSTLEYYYDEIEQRLDFWKAYGDLSGLDFKYENIFDINIEEGKWDYILAQDTLHHLEPFGQAAQILKTSLKEDGMLVVSEENGNNIFNNLKNFKNRGFKRITTMYDEKLQKSVLIGDENTRSLKGWIYEFSKVGMQIHPDSVGYIRYYFPHKYDGQNTQALIAKEFNLSKKDGARREFMFFGLTFTAGR